MRELRWSPDAVDDLERIADYLFQHTPFHAERLVSAIHDAPLELLDFPFLGRTGSVLFTRELVLSPLPYIVVYSVSDFFSGHEITIVRILHGSQQWP